MKKNKNIPLIVVGLLALTGCDHSSPKSHQPLTGQDWPVFDGKPSGRANQSVIVNGEFVGTDEIHFARGANADGIDHEEYYAVGGTPPEPAPTPVEDDDVYRHATFGAFGADRAAHNGDYLLPTDTVKWPDFTADLVFFRAEANASDLFIQIRYASFPSANTQIATVTFTPVDETAALKDWPRNAGVSSAYSAALTIWGNGAELLSSSGSPSSIVEMGGEVRVAEHAIEARIPLSVLPAGPWNIGVGSGLADPADHTQYWTVPAGAPTATQPGTDAITAPGSNVWDLMFTPHDPLWHDDHIQADLLMSGDVSAAVTMLNPSELQAKATTIAEDITGRITHTYQSAFDFGDGITRGTPATPPVPPLPLPVDVRPRDLAVSYEYTGGVQPYFAYIPQAYPDSTEDWPLVLYFHGLNNYIWEPFGLTLGIEEELEQRGYLFASTLGRGDISYTDRGELDPLEVIEHMAARYRIDRSRIYILGHSHGGGGVMNVSRRNPDKFAAVVSAQIMNTSELPENYRYVPTLHIAGQADPIDSGAGARSRYDGLSALGYDTQLYLYPTKTHENSSIYDAIEQIFDIFDRSQQPLNPAIVNFTRAANDVNQELGLLHNSAYWVSELVANDVAAAMSINIESFAIPHQQLDPTAAAISNDQLTDTNGASGRSIALHSQTIPAFGETQAVSNSVDIVTSNVSEMRLDTLRMGLTSDQEISLSLDLSHTLDLSLIGLSGQLISWSQFDSNNSLLSQGQSHLEDGAYLISVSTSTKSLRVD